MKTPMQITLKIRLRHSELGITAGRPSFSWRPTQRMKDGIRATPRIRVDSVSGSLIFSVCLEITLEVVSRGGGMNGKDVPEGV